MEEFIEFFGVAHLNNKNIAAYRNDEGVILKAENIVKDKILGTNQFNTFEAAEDWFCSQLGINNISRLDSAINVLKD